MPDFAVSAAIKANGVQFLNTFNAMRSGLRSFGSEAKSAFERAIPGGRALSGVFHSMAGQVAIGNLLSRGITAIGREIAQLPRQLEDFAARGQEIGRTASIVGSSAENWQRMSYAAKMTDTPVETLQNAMQKLNKNMADFTIGKGSLKDIAKYGPPGLAKQIRSTHDTTEAMMFLADAVTNTKDAQLRAAIAQSAFGKAGQDMLPFLLKGRIEIGRLTKETDKFEYIFGKKAIDASDRMDTAMKHLRGSVDYLRSTVMATTMEALTPYIEKAVDWVSTHKDLIAQKIPEYIDKIRDAGKKVWGIISDVKDIWDDLNALANGHLARDILLVVAAWKSVRLAIDLATAAATAYKLISGGGVAAGAAQAAWSIGKGFAPAVAPTLAVVAAPAAIAAGIVLATAATGQAYAGWQNSMITDPKQIAGGNRALMSPRQTVAFDAMRLATALRSSSGGSPGIMTPALAGALNQQATAPNASAPAAPAQSVDVSVFLKWLGDNKGVHASVAPPLMGIAGHQYGMQ